MERVQHNVVTYKTAGDISVRCVVQIYHARTVRHPKAGLTVIRVSVSCSCLLIRILAMLS